MFRDEVKFQGIIICFQIIALIALYLTLKPTDILGDELLAKDVMTQVWFQTYPSKLRTEVYFGKELEGSKRDVGIWVDFNTQKSLLFIGKYKNSKFSKRSGGVLYEASNNSFGYRVIVSRETGRRSRAKERKGNYDALSNSTQMNYFDIVRNIFPENANDFEFSFCKRMASPFMEDVKYAVRVVPKNMMSGDYPIRIFSIKKMEDNKLVIVGVEYRDIDGKLSKTRINSHFNLYEIDGDSFWRANQTQIFTTASTTTLRFSRRKFNIDLKNLSKKDLKKGRPPKWRD